MGNIYKLGYVNEFESRKPELCIKIDWYTYIYVHDINESYLRYHVINYVDSPNLDIHIIMRYQKERDGVCHVYSYEKKDLKSLSRNNNKRTTVE